VCAGERKEKTHRRGIDGKEEEEEAEEEEEEEEEEKKAMG
jgi:hypothetical protein